MYIRYKNDMLQCLFISKIAELRCSKEISSVQIAHTREGFTDDIHIIEKL